MGRHRIVGFAGSFSNPSRTRALVGAIAAAAARHTGGVAEVLDLAGLTGELGATLDARTAPPGVARLIAAISEADLLVIGSPVYKGTYGGLFKHVLDLVDPKALRDKPVALAATGGSERHALVLDHGLRPLLAFFSADIVPTAVYGTESDFTDAVPSSPQIIERIARSATELSSRSAAIAGNGGWRAIA